MRLSSGLACGGCRQSNSARSCETARNRGLSSRNRASGLLHRSQTSERCRLCCSPYLASTSIPDLGSARENAVILAVEVPLQREAAGSGDQRHPQNIPFRVTVLLIGVRWCEGECTSIASTGSLGWEHRGWSRCPHRWRWSFRRSPQARQGGDLAWPKWRSGYLPSAARRGT